MRSPRWPPRPAPRSTIRSRLYSFHAPALSCATRTPGMDGVDVDRGLTHTLTHPRIWKVRVSTPPVPPDARVLWCLRRRSSDVRCVLYAAMMPVEVRILQDRDVVLAELFPEEDLAVRWAEAYGERLRQQGWTERAETQGSSPVALTP